MKPYKNLKEKLIISAVILVYAAIRQLMGLPCILLRLTGYPCPGCGMTRALLAALQLRVVDAFQYHWMFWTLPLLYLCFLKDGKLFSTPLWNGILYAGIMTGFLINWLRNIIFL